MEIRRIEEEGSRFYRIDERSSTLYDCVEQAAWCIKGRRPDAALEHIRAGEKLDAANPVFEYLRAMIAADKGDMPAAMVYIRKANAKGVMKVYASRNVSPDRWQAGGVELVSRLTRRIASDPDSSKQILEAALAMADKITWCEPPDMVRTLSGILARQSVARKLLKIARNDGDYRLAKFYEDLMSEGQNFRLAVRRKLAHTASFDPTTRAWTIGKALPQDDRRFREAALLLVLDKQAAWAGEYRRMFLKTKVARDLGR